MAVRRQEGGQVTFGHAHEVRREVVGAQLACLDPASCGSLGDGASLGDLADGEKALSARSKG